MTMIWGDTIGLRPFEDPVSDADAARVFQWSRDNAVLRWSGGVQTELTLDEFRDHLRGERWHAPINRRAFFILTRPFDSAQGGELIGRIGVFAIDREQRDGELGIIIGEPTQWGKHYGRDAVRTLLRLVFATTTLDRVYLFTFDENIRAQRCFRACGFRPLGAKRRFSPDVGEYDGIEMEITRREFLEQRAPIQVALAAQFEVR
ncbi:MAG: GNAT family N-acetyltransferase [Chloroflexi bacterium]|nr:GNAT family N-acetyltransferase [Chloroflexota bacterium]